MTMPVRIWLACAASLGAGALLGAGAMFLLADRTINAERSMAAAAGAGTKLAVLKELQAANVPKAVSILEGSLDGDLTVIGLTPTAMEDQDIGRVVKRVAEYRQLNPRVPGDSGVDSFVAKVLESATKNKDATVRVGK